MSYTERIGQAASKRPDIFGIGVVVHIDVKHDNACSMLDGRECKCFPDIIATTKQGKYAVGDDGNCESIQPSRSEPS